MTLEAFATQTGSFSAELTRRALTAQYARTAANSPGVISGGLVASGDLAVTAPGSGMSVNISTGEALVGGTEGAAQGGYYFRNTASASVSVAGANASLPRVDIVVVTIADAGYTQPSDVGGTTNGGVLAVVTGTPTAGANILNVSGAPSIPLSSLLLGYVVVPAASTNVTAGNLSNNAAVVGTQGLLTGAAARSNPGVLASPTVTTPTRALTTVYQPSTSRPTVVAVEFNTGSGGGGSILSDASNPPTTERGRFYSAASTQAQGTVTILVLPGHYYELTNIGGTVSVLLTTEWSL